MTLAVVLHVMFACSIVSETTHVRVTLSPTKLILLLGETDTEERERKRGRERGREEGR